MTILVTIRMGAGTKLDKVEDNRIRDDCVRVWVVRPHHGKRYGKEIVEVTASKMLGSGPIFVNENLPFPKRQLASLSDAGRQWKSSPMLDSLS